MVIANLLMIPLKFFNRGYEIKRTYVIVFNTGDKKLKVAEPSAPQNLNVSSVSSDAISITWSAPTEDGGKPIQKYVICMKEVGTKKLRKVRNQVCFRMFHCTRKHSNWKKAGSGGPVLCKRIVIIRRRIPKINLH